MRFLRSSIVLILACAVSAPQAREAAAPDPSTTEGRAALDPWEPMNRRTHRFNQALDRRVMKPVARGYVRAVPRPVRTGIGNFFNNLQEPVTALNLLGQGRPQQSGRTVLRFLLNSTIGVAGLFDVASYGGSERYKADFGQTFAHWGWRDSRYLVLPVFGPSTVRDGAGRLVNSRVSPINEFTERTSPAVGVLYGVTARAYALPNEAFMEGAEDDYLLLRDVYFQRRECQLRDCSQDLPDYELPEELGVVE